MTARLQSAQWLTAAAAGACLALSWSVHAPAPEPAGISVVPVAADVGTGPSGAPRRIEIPAIGVAADVERVRAGDDGELPAPSDWNDAGWFADGVVPGERGPAVMVGHVDSRVGGPAVFYRLHDLRPGDEIELTSDRGRTRFVVETVTTAPKDAFPTAAVYGPTPLPQLRLITCTGAFAGGSYRDNLIVTARLDDQGSP
ncbi:sortase [Mycobacterium sp. MYCO198283]|uniref:sortase domain-containing protein n=1 Tax=Mycobacterium sp. MYCO198283 TaxID=2883505 RepID=UPI001E609EDB|nr:sortase [Mycobacterium sp. MYCO198283]MCG5431008.1 sortase [Mycobacterium sp. MYCO198283]